MSKLSNLGESSASSQPLGDTLAETATFTSNVLLQELVGLVRDQRDLMKEQSDRSHAGPKWNEDQARRLDEQMELLKEQNKIMKEQSELLRKETKSLGTLEQDALRGMFLGSLRLWLH